VNRIPTYLYSHAMQIVERINKALEIASMAHLI